MAADWSLLPDDILEMIGKKLDSVKDVVGSSFVCKSWRATNTLKSPWLVLFSSVPKESPTRQSSISGLVCLGDQKLYKHHLPDPMEFRCIGSTSDCLILHKVKGNTISLFHPFRGFTPTNLPPLDMVCYSKIPRIFILQFSAASSFHRNSNGGYIAMNFYDCRSKNQTQSELMFVRDGDSCWTKAQAPHGPLCDVIFYGEKIYGVNLTGQVTEWVLSNEGNSLQLRFSRACTIPIVRSRSSGTYHQYGKFYLVEWKGGLLVVRKTCRFKNTKKRFKVYKVDLNTGPSSPSRPRELKSLGAHSLFLGLNNSVSVLATDYSGCVKPNCIYFTDDRLRAKSQHGEDMGVFDLETGRLQSHYINDSICHWSLPLWIVPTPPPVEKESRKRKSPDYLDDAMSSPKRTNSLKELLY